MATCGLESVNRQRSGSTRSVNHALHVFRARPGNSSALSQPADLERQKAARLRAEELQRRAFLEMFESSRPRFLALARGILRNTEDAEDALHDAFVSGYLNLRSFECRSALTTWFTRIVFNAALMVLRKRKSSRVVQFLEASARHESTWAERIVGSQPDPEVVYGERETFQLIEEHLSKMKPLLGQAFRMTHFEDLSTREACARLRVTSGTFKARLLRVRRKLLKRVRRVQVAPIHRAKLPARRVGPPFGEASPS